MNRSRLVPVLLATVLLVGAANLAAYAANGRPLLLGSSNTASKTTTLKNTKGTALTLKSKKGTPPLKVSSSEKVKKLNADLVDGLDGTALQTKTYLYNLSGTAASTQINFTLPGLPAGRYLASYNVSATTGAGPATSFACLFNAGSSSAVSTLGRELAGGSWFVSGSGYLDTTALTYTLTCLTDDPGITVPLETTPPSKSQVVLTRVDDLTTRATTGS